MPEEAICPTCRCTVVVTQQGTCPMGHPIDAADVQAAARRAVQPPEPATQQAPAATAPPAAAPAAVPTAAPQAPPGQPDDPFAAPAPGQAAPPQAAPVEAAPPPTGGSALPAPDESDFLSQPGPDQAAAQKSERKTSPVLIILLVIVLVIALAAAGVFLFAPELIGMAMLAAFILA